MSGGSGSRVNSYTKHVIDQLQHHNQVLEDHAFYQLPSDVDPVDLVWDRPPTPLPDPLESLQLNFLEQPEPIDPYEGMAPGTVKITTIYDRRLPMQPSHSKLARDILRDTIFWKDGFEGDLEECLSKIEQCSNFQILKVSTVQNVALWKMYNAFKEAYNIQDERTNYHGSLKAHAICHEGFRGAACERSVWGKGTCTSSNFWEAAAYCEGDVITVLIVKTLVGEHKVGSKDLMDFGVNEHGKAYNTVTNDRQTIFCCKNEAQLCPTVQITMQYMHENKHTDAHNDFVQIYNHDLKNRIIINNAPFFCPAAAAAAAAAAAGSSGAPLQPPKLKWEERPHVHWPIGHEVKINLYAKLDKKFEEYLGFRGNVERTFARGSDYKIFVKLTFDRDGNPVKVGTETDVMQKNHGSLMFLSGPARSCLPCRPGHLESYNAKREEFLAAAAKRQADDQPDDQADAGAKKPRP